MDEKAESRMHTNKELQTQMNVRPHRHEGAFATLYLRKSAFTCG
jgi:hypothetical protein